MTDATVENVDAGNAPAPRKKFTFTKRDPVAAAKIEAERKASMKNVRNLIKCLSVACLSGALRKCRVCRARVPAWSMPLAAVNACFQEWRYMYPVC